jgi:hypothetical protein
MTGRAVTLVAVAFVGCALSQGCASRIREPTAGIEAHYHWDVLKAKVDRSIWDVYAAAQQAVDELQLRVVCKKVDGLAAEIRAVDAHFDNVCVELGALPRSRTKLRIRIGLWGDKCKSIVLFQNVLAHLGAEQGSAAPPRREEPDDSSGGF